MEGAGVGTGLNSGELDEDHSQKHRAGETSITRSQDVDPRYGTITQTLAADGHRHC